MDGESYKGMYERFPICVTVELGNGCTSKVYTFDENEQLIRMIEEECLKSIWEC